ncbi:hypothetical protein BDB01DRAFT_804570 [Pilobolus umbonatus]|nr:hypothetical protein BDB01DRAFT_804570 [Pilobolus umbonatus]
MSTVELLHTLNILQHKLTDSHNEQRNKIRNIMTKKSLLQQSYTLLQDDLHHTLKEDNKGRVVIKSLSTRPLEGMIPLTSHTSLSDIHQSDMDSKQEWVSISKCYGWIKGRRVWIQAEGYSLVDSIDRVCLSVLSTDSLLPDTISFNSLCHVDRTDRLYLHCSFDLLPDLLPTHIMKDSIQVKALIEYRHMEYTSEGCAIEWANDQIEWLNPLSSQYHAIHLFYPFHIKLHQSMSMDHITSVMNELHPVDNTPYLRSPSHTLLIHCIKDTVDIYGLNTVDVVECVIRLIPLLNSKMIDIMSSTHINQKGDMLMGLGMECIALQKILERKGYPYRSYMLTRGHTRLILSHTLQSEYIINAIVNK